jgi:hypothetical protein
MCAKALQFPFEGQHHNPKGMQELDYQSYILSSSW